MEKFSKGTLPRSAKYAFGGPGDTSRSRFMKAPDQFRTDVQKTDYEKTGKTGEMSKPRGETKLKKVIKPQK